MGGAFWLRHSRHVLETVMVTVLLSVAGCNSVEFTAENLPRSLRVAPRANPQTVDLSRLAGSTVSSELVAPGDVLEVTIAAGLSDADTVTFPVRVDDDGSANLPVIGKVPVADLELDGAEAAIATACIHRGVYKAPHVTVTMKRQRLNQITVVGAVEAPGTYGLPRKGSNLLAAIVAAEGLAKDAGEDVEVRLPRGSEGILMDDSGPDRVAETSPEGISTVGHSAVARGSTQGAPVLQAAGNMMSTRINLVSAAMDGTKNYNLPDGAVVMVQRRDPEPVQVLGLVNTPGTKQFPVGKDLRLLDAIALAGGMSNGVADKVYVIRRLPNRVDPAVIEVSFNKAKRSSASNLRLQPGDVVSVEQTPQTVVLEAIKLIRFGVGASLGTFF